MSARELHRFVRDAGKRNLGFKDVQPFVDKQRFSLVELGKVIAFRIEQSHKTGVPLSREEITILGMLLLKGVLIHPVTKEVCLRLDTNPLSVDGIPFHVYFNPESAGHCKVEGTFIDTGWKGNTEVFLSLSVAIYFLSNYLAWNNLKSLKADQIGREHLMKLHEANALSCIPHEQLLPLSHQLIGGRLYEAELARLFTGNSVESYMGLVECMLVNVALHESAHVLHKAAGIIGAGGRGAEEERAYLTEFAYGNPGLTFPYLPKNEQGANGEAARLILENVFKRQEFKALMDMDGKALSALAKALLDENFVASFGRHHDEMVSQLDLERVRRHHFFGKEHLPLFDSLRFLPDKKAKKAA